MLLTAQLWPYTRLPKIIERLTSQALARKQPPFLAQAGPNTVSRENDRSRDARNGCRVQNVLTSEDVWAALFETLFPDWLKTVGHRYVNRRNDTALELKKKKSSVLFLIGVRRARTSILLVYFAAISPPSSRVDRFSRFSQRCIAEAVVGGRKLSPI